MPSDKKKKQKRKKDLLSPDSNSELPDLKRANATISKEQPQPQQQQQQQQQASATYVYPYTQQPVPCGQPFYGSQPRHRCHIYRRFRSPARLRGLLGVSNLKLNYQLTLYLNYSNDWISWTKSYLIWNPFKVH